MNTSVICYTSSDFRRCLCIQGWKERRILDIAHATTASLQKAASPYFCSRHTFMHLVHRKNCVGGSSSPLVCCIHQYAFLLPHFSQLAFVIGIEETSFSMTMTFFSGFAISVIFTAFTGFFITAPHERHLSCVDVLLFSGSMMEPHLPQNSMALFPGAFSVIIHSDGGVTLYILCGIKMGMGVNMRDFNIVKIDSKGRMIIPFQLRDYLRLREGTQVIITNNENKELKIIPLLDSTVYIEIIFIDEPASLMKIIDVMARNKMDILMSTSKTIERRKLAEWNAIADAASSNLAKLEADMIALKGIKKFRVDTKI